MGYFKKRDDLSEEQIDHLKDIHRILVSDFKDIQKMINDTEISINNILELQPNRVRDVIVSTVNIGHRLKSFRDDLRDFRSILTISDKPKINESKNNINKKYI